MCPLSNLKLCVVDGSARAQLRARCSARGVAVTINSDDPAYFGGYIGENYRAIAEALELTADELVPCADNAARASFLPPDAKDALLARIRAAAR